MGSVSAQLIDELGYDPDDGVPELADLRDVTCASSPARPHGTGRGVARSVDRSVGRGTARGLARGAMIAARIGARRVAVARLASGRLVVVADECPHDGGRISDGFVDGERLVCARHGWELEARNGRCERACKPRE
jgi:nitrite reductase/ring-hydroxylating ferredoxin subunit